MVTSVTVFDEDWTEDDMDAALEWQTEQAMKCGGCGGFVDETMAAGADDSYEAEVQVCHKCAAGDRARRAFMQQDSPDTAGLKVRMFDAD